MVVIIAISFFGGVHMAFVLAFPDLMQMPRDLPVANLAK
jgi:hypothetical protein